MAASPSTVTTLDYALKENYNDQNVESLTLQEQPFLDQLLKDETFSGDVKPYPVIYAGGQGIAATAFSTAQSNKTTASGEKWNITVGDLYGYTELGDKALEAARDSPGSFLDHTMTEIDELLGQLGNDLNLQFWGNGGAPFGQRSSISTNTVTLSSRFDVTNFEVGMTVVASAADGSGSSDALRSGSTTVASLDYEAGTVTLTSAAAITSFADSDYLFRAGSFAGDVSQTAIVKGVQAWVPASAPGSTAFFGVDRTTSTKLSGYRLPTAANKGTLEERARKLATEIYTSFGTTPKKGWLHPRQWERMSQELSNNGHREITVKNAAGTFGYDALRMKSVYGDVSFCSDRHCPTTAMYLMDPKHVKCVSMRKLVHPMNKDGLKMLRVNNAAAYEMRFVSYPQLCIQKPSAVGRATLTAVS